MARGTACQSAMKAVGARMLVLYPKFLRPEPQLAFIRLMLASGRAQPDAGGWRQT